VGARTYDPRTARWLQRDPIDAASGDPNLYRYCGNDPINRVDIDGSNSEEKHPDNSAGKKAKDKTQQKVASVCVGDTDLGNPIANLALAARLAGELWAIQRALEQQGYTVIVDRDCTEEEAINALKDESIKAFVFIGHANEYELGMYGEGDPVLDVDEVRSALGGRKLERVDLRGCHTDSPAWREAFGNPDSFDGIKGLYNPVFGIDWGNLLGDKKPPSKKKREGTPKGRKRPN